MNSDNKTDFQKYVEESEEERSIQKEKIIQDYTNGDEEYKQNYWDGHFCRGLYQAWHIDYPVDIKTFREKYKDIEPNIERFLPGIVKAMEENTGTQGADIEGIFTLDEKSRKYLENIGYLQQQEIRNKIIEIIENKEAQEILGKNISFDELVERIGDLYYDSFASFLENLGEHIYDEEVKQIVKQSSDNIKNAWILCKPEVEKFIKKGGEVGKHNNEVKGIKTSNEELAKMIGNLVSYKLSDFLKKLSEKIQRDGEADKGRDIPRIKLANELFACADKLKQASDLLK